MDISPIACLVTAITCFYAGRYDKKKTINELSRDRANLLIVQQEMRSSISKQKNYEKLFHETSDREKSLKEQNQYLIKKVSDLQFVLNGISDSLAEQDNEISSLKKRLKNQNVEKSNIKQIYESFQSLRRSIRTKDLRYTSPSVRILFQKMQFHLHELISLQARMDSLAKKFHRLHAHETRPSIYEEREDYRQHLIKINGAIDVFINWDDSRAHRYFFSMNNLHDCHNFLAILFRSIDSMKAIIIPDTCKKFIH